MLPFFLTETVDSSTSVQSHNHTKSYRRQKSVHATSALVNISEYKMICCILHIASKVLCRSVVEHQILLGGKGISMSLFTTLVVNL